MNVISQVSFGIGIFRDFGGRGRGKPYVLPPLGPTGEEVIVFEVGELRSKLTFSWFLRNIICPEKPEVCSPEFQNVFDVNSMRLVRALNLS